MLVPRLLLLILAAWPASSQISLFPQDLLTDSADFGTAVAASDTLVAVGAQNNHNNSGAVFLFDLNSGLLLAELNATEVGANFGCALGLCGTTLVVGAQYARANSGAVFVYDVSAPARPILKAELRASGSARFFGGAVSLICSGSQETLLIGAASGDTLGQAFFATRATPGDAFGPVTPLTPPAQSPGAGANYAQALVLDARRHAAVSANHANNLSGAVYWFADIASAHTPPVVVDVPASPGAYAGSSMALNSDGTLLAVGAPFDHNNDGLVLLYRIPDPAAGPVFWLYLKLNNANFEGTNFGITLLFTAPNTLAVGAWGVNPAGGVFLFDIAPPNLPVLAAVIPAPAAASTGAFFGSALASASSYLICGADGDHNDLGGAYIMGST